MRKVLLLVLGFMLFCPALRADIPKVINYQGRLTDLSGDPVANGQYSVTFRLYDAITAGNEKWSGVYDVRTLNGYFEVVLGSGGYVFSSGVDFSQTYFLEVRVGSDTPMTPRQQLTSVPYALNVPDGAITTEKMKPTWASKSSKTDYTFNGSTPVEIQDMRTSITVNTPSVLLIIYAGDVSNTTSMEGVILYLEVDGTRITEAGYFEGQNPGTGDGANSCITLTKIHPVLSGTHVIKVWGMSQNDGFVTGLSNSDISIMAFGQ